MLRSILIFLFLYSSFAVSNEVNFRLSPEDPIVGEEFFLLVNVKTGEKGEPYISFDPGRLKVLGRDRTGTSHSFTIINGKASTQRSFAYQYRLRSERGGTFSISNIEVDIGGKIVKSRPIRVKVLNKRKESPDIFVRAEISKNEAYVGEGLDLVYYLYTRLRLVEKNLEDYPKLKDFTKRFIDPDRRKETVEFGGKLYERAPQYAARIFPDKSGKVVIDPLRIGVRFLNRGGRLMSRTLSSKILELKILELPASDVPRNFTGLVGKHDFKLSIPRTKYLVNEAIEMRLEVTGDGALETMEAPVFISHEFLEEFDTKSEISPLGSGRVKSHFDYTYLARDSFALNEKEMELFYFDPELKEYVGVNVKVPEIIVGGASVGSVSSGGEEKKKESNQLKDNKPSDKIVTARHIVAPSFVEGGGSFTLSKYLKYINGTLALFLLFIYSWVFFEFRPKKDMSLVRQIDKIKSGKFSYHDLFSLFSRLEGRESVVVKIEKSDLMPETKKFFTILYKEVEKESFKNNKTMIKRSIKRKHVKELKRVLDQA